MGESPRLTIRISSEVDQILSLVDQKRKSLFVRDAILYYAKYGNSPDLSPRTYSDEHSREFQHTADIDSDSESAPVIVVNKPAWQR